MSKRFYKTVLIMMLLFILVPLDAYASSSVESKDFSSKQNVPLDKTWAIEFSDKVSSDKIDAITIERNQESLPITTRISGNKVIVAPVNKYISNENYTLKVFLTNGKNYKMNFTTASQGKLEDVKDVYLENFDYLNYQEKDSYNGWEKWDLNDKGSTGITSNHGIKYYMDSRSDENWQYTEYLLNRNYSTFKGSFVLHQDNKSVTKGTYLEIFGDDKLLYKSETINCDNGLVDFNVEVNDVKILKAQIVQPNGNTDTNYGIINSVFVGKKNVVVNTIKDYPTTKPDIYLEELEYLSYQEKDSYNGWEKWTLNDKDSIGKTYTHGIRYYLDSRSDENWQYTEYLLNKNYSSFKGSFVISYNNRTSIKDTYLRVYGDDELIYTSETMRASVLPINFDINVEEVTRLRIEINQPNGNEDTYYGLVNAGFYRTSSDVLNVIQDYPTTKPDIYLEELEYLSYQEKDSYNGWDKWNLGNKDSIGKSYTHGIRYYLDSRSDENWQYTEYLLNENYSSFKGSFVLDYNNRSTTKDTFLRVYGDDELLYNSESLKASVLPINFNIDVTGVTRLRIEINQPNGNEDTYYGLVNAGFYRVSSSVFNEIEDYPQIKPDTYLEELKHSNYQEKDSYNGWENWSLGNKDSIGKTYSHGIRYYMDSRSDENWQYTEYLLNGSYSSFKGSFVLDYTNRSVTGDTYLRVYGDDKLLYNSETMKASVLPINFDIDVRGVTKLKIEINQPKGNGDTYYGLVNTGFYK